MFQDRYYLEVQAHDSAGQSDLNRKVFHLAGETGLPVVATNDAHFLRREDHEAHDVLLCIGLGKDHDDQNRMRYDEGLYFKSAPEMAERFPDHPEVLENTLAIADQVDVSFEKKYFLPEFPLPEDHRDSDGYLRHLAVDGAKKRYGDPLPDKILERLDYELGVIAETGYAGYFLITWDFIRWAREHGIPVGPGRGSAAGSLVAYSLWITNIDPIAFGLLFERFLNPERNEMPDIDIDFCFERRGEVIDYVRRKYGRDAVGQIITFGTMKSRAVVRDVGRTLGFKPSENRPDREDDPESARTGADHRAGPGAHIGRQEPLRAGRAPSKALRLFAHSGGAEPARFGARRRSRDRAGAALRLCPRVHPAA